MNGMWERRGSTQDGQGDSLKALEEPTSGGPRHPGGLSLGYICGQEGQTNDSRAVKGVGALSSGAINKQLYLRLLGRDFTLIL